MRRNTLYFLIDLLGFIFLVGLTSTGSIMKWALPPGTGGRHEGQGEQYILHCITIG